MSGLPRILRAGQLFHFVLPDPSGFHDPEFPTENLLLDCVKQGLDQRNQNRFRRTPRYAQDSHTGRFRRWRGKDIAKVVIHRDENPLLQHGCVQNDRVTCPAEMLIADSSAIVASSEEDLLDGWTEILVEFKLHDFGEMGIGTNRSRATSAP